nr:hypothetical protein [uncultured Carboxylicivirga sp.]
MKTIPFSIFSLHERFLLLQLTENLLESRLEALPELSDIYERIKALRVKMEQALHISRTSEFSKQINDQDEVQDNGFLCFRMMVEAQGYSILDDSLKEKAGNIEEIIRRHGWRLTRLGNKKQLAVSLSLINELSLEANQQVLGDLNVLPQYNAWKDAVMVMDGLYVEKAEVESAQEDITAATALGKQGVDLLEKVLPGWAYQSEFGNKTAYGELLNAIMESVSDMETQARTRITKRKASKAEEEN